VNESIGVSVKRNSAKKGHSYYCVECKKIHNDVADKNLYDHHFKYQTKQDWGR
jgi:hypothetical protein